MVKIKTNGVTGTLVAEKKRKTTAKDPDSDSDDDASLINVGFEWFDPQEIDYHGLKLLLRQLFDTDNTLFDLSALVNLILSQPLLGSTVKVPSDEENVETRNTDPFAFLTVLNLRTHAANPAIQALTSYIVEKSKAIPTLSSTLAGLLAPQSTAQVGLILSERFINMPHEIVPPMYKMLLEEMQWANEEGEPYTFSHYLVLSKTYREIASKLDAMVITEDDDDAGERPSKKSKKSGKKGGAAAGGTADGEETFFFHGEDEVFQRHAVGFGGFRYESQAEGGAGDAKRAFQDAGIEPTGHLVLIEAGAFEKAVAAVSEYLGQGA